MTAENSTADETASNTTNQLIDFTTKTLFDPTWQLALTIEFYFQCALIAIGIFGIAANALVLYALIAYHVRERKKREVILLMINQNVLDLLSCVLAVITFSIKVSNIYLSGVLGYFLCTIIISENATNCMLFASIINLSPQSLASFSFSSFPVFINNSTLFIPELAAIRFVTVTIFYHQSNDNHR